jgi:hypothetical protein
VDASVPVTKQHLPVQTVGVAQPSGPSGVVKTLLGMSQNFLECDREQVFLLPPDPRDWLPEGHFAWFVLESVQEMDLSAFYASYRLDGWGRAAFEPSMMVSLLCTPTRGVNALRAGLSAGVWRMLPTG